MPDTFVRTRCGNCQKILNFEDFSAGGSRCLACSRGPSSTEFVRGPRIRRTNARNLRAPRQEEQAYEELLDGLPDELIDELVAALEAEAAKLPASPANPMRGMLDELGIGRSLKERQWAAWGFAAGFAANVAMAKYAQMASGAPMGQFIGPLLVGGVVAGLCCSAIGWGFAKLRSRANTA